MGRTLENKQQIVEELKQLLGEAEMALVLDYKGLSIKEMSDLRGRLAANGICKVTKNTAFGLRVLSQRPLATEDSRWRRFPQP